MKELADLTKRLFKGQTTLKQEFGVYSYTREDWIRENEARTANS